MDTVSVEIVIETPWISGKSHILLWLFGLIPFSAEDAKKQKDVWEMTPEQIKFKNETDGPHPYRIYLVQDGAQLNKIPMIPGTVVVIEDSQELKYVDDDSNLCAWAGNSGEHCLWRGQVLFWNGTGIKWADPSTTERRPYRTRKPRKHIKQLDDADIAAMITKRRSKKPPITSLSEAEELRRVIDHLQAVIKEKDGVLMKIKETLNQTIEENRALRAQLLVGPELISPSMRVHPPSKPFPNS